MLAISSRAWPFWLAFCCWCCVALIQGEGVTDDGSEENLPSKNHGGRCTDDIKNQDETDIDCGGIKCPRCADTQTCKQNCDCISSVCKNNKCARKESDGLCSDAEISGTKPVLLITFGSGAPQYSTVTPKKFGFTTTYKQRTEPNTGDGYFSFINSIHDDNDGAWHTGATDHTKNKGGYMFLVNADEKPGEFYKGTVNNLCVGKRYEFSVFLANVCKPNRCPIKPNVMFQVRTTVGNDLLAQLSSGDVAEHDALEWKKYGLSFTAKTSSVVLLMISNAPGGSGNDLVIDDIALRVCGGEGSGICPSNS